MKELRILKTGLLVILLVAANFALMAGTAVGDEMPPQETTTEIEIEYTFGAPVVVQEGETCTVSMEGAESYGEPGYPVLPQKTVFVALPAGEELAEVIVEGNTHRMNLDWEVVWGQEPTVIGEEPEEETPKDEMVYESQNSWPTKTHEVLPAQIYKGYRIQPVMLYPAQYMPKLGMLDYYSDMTLTVVTSTADVDVPDTYRGLEKDMALVGETVDNPSTLATYGDGPEATQLSALVDPAMDYDYVIITGQQFANGFAPFVQYKNGIGLRTVLVNVEDIYAEQAYNGVDDAEEVRNFIKDAYANWGIDYVLLGGDVEVVPYRGVYLSSQFPNAPCDNYFACLDGNWNADGDEYWGESGEEDWYAEVYIGRVTFDQSYELDNWIDKTLLYEKGLTGSTDQVLLVGEQLDSYTWGGDYMDDVQTHFPPDEPWVYTKLYEKDDTFSKAAVIDALNTGTNLVNHMGHANYHYNMGMVDSDVDALTNEDPYFAYSQGCMAGGFDDPVSGTGECIAEHHIFNDGGAFAVIMNARYGWYYRGSVEGPSQQFHRAFIDGLLGDYDTSLGAANQYSKDANYDYITTSFYGRFCALELNLLGDPTLVVNRPFMYEHEVGITSLNAPELVSLGAEVPVEVRLRNMGKYEERVTVEFLVDGILEDTQTVTVPKGSKVSVYFTWNAPNVEGIHTLAAQLIMVGDENPDNNYAETQVEVADIVTVDDDGPADYDSISEAVRKEKAGKTIYVYPGTYNENVVVTKTFTIRGSEREMPVVNGGGGVTFTLKADDIVLKGFYITGGSYGLVFQRCTGCLVEKNTIAKNSEAGVFFDGVSGNTLRLNAIEDNRKYGAGTGVLMSDSDGNAIEDNTIQDHADYGVRTENSASSLSGNLISDNRYGIWVHSGTVQITGNTIKSNWQGVFCSGLTTPNIDSNDFNGNYYGIYSEEGATPAITNNRFCRCTGGELLEPEEIVTWYTQYGIYIHASEPSIISGNSFENVGTGIYIVEANPTICGNTFNRCWRGVYVGYTSPQVCCNEFISNTYGVYSWYGNPLVESNTFSGGYSTGVYLYNSPGAVVQYNLFDGHYTGVRIHGNSDALIAGNTLQNGYIGISAYASAPALTDNVMENHYSYGLSIDYSAAETIPKMENNLIDGYDASMFYYYNETDLVLDGYTISGKFTAHGIFTFYDCTGVTVQNCDLSGNRYGVYLKNSAADILYNTISDSRYGSINLYNSEGTVGYNTMESVYYKTDGISLYDTSPLVIGNTITGGDFGIYMDRNSRPTLTDNTISDCWYGITIPYECREVIATMSGNTVNGLDLNMVYHYNEDGTTIRNFDYTCGFSGSGWYWWYSRINTEGLITLYDCTDVTVQNCDLGGNTYGLYAINSDATVTGCSFFDNLDGVYFDKAPGTVTVQNSVAYGNFGNGFYFYDCDLQVSGNTAYENRGYFFWLGDYPEEEFWVSTDFIFWWQGYGFYLGQCSGVVENNDAYDNIYGIYTYGKKSTVSIQNNNVYDNRRGIYASYTSGSIIGNTIESNRDGLYLYSYTGTASGNTITNNPYVGVYLRYGRPTLSGNTITDNYAGVLAYYADMVVDGNTISHNKYDGMQCSWSSGTVSNNVVSHNGNNGIYLYQSSPTITGNAIDENGNNGIYCYYNSDALITGNTFYKNYWYSVYVYRSSPTITYNTMEDYGAVLSRYSYPLIQYNTITGCFIAINSYSGQPTVQYNTISNVFTAFYAYNIYGATITDNEIDGAQYGIRTFRSSFDCYRNDISNCQVGIYMGWSTTLYMEENTISYCQVGIETYSGWGYSYGTVWQNTITHNQVGIWLKAGSDFVIGYNDITYNQYGIRLEGRNWYGWGHWHGIPALAEIRNNNIYGNSQYGIYNEHLDLGKANRDSDGNIVVIDAANNWWGDKSGPYDPNDYDGLGQYNPDGKGDEVSEYILYTPWEREAV